MLDESPDQSPDNTTRKRWMEVLAQAPSQVLVSAFEGLGDLPDFTYLRTPEFGLVMVRGRMGAVGSGFNMGEVTVTRCSVRLETGQDGHAYVQGRGKEKASTAALVDALMQTAEAPGVETAILKPLRIKSEARRTERAEKAAATKVDFFTMARGED